MGENFLKTIVNQYKQQKRWAWGVIEIPYVFLNFLKNKKIPINIKKKLKSRKFNAKGFMKAINNPYK